MEENKVGCIIVFGGDGTCRLVSKHIKETPILPVSTGTNNLFPLNLEGTVVGIAAAKFCLLKNIEKYSKREKKLEIYANNKLVDSSLVDVVISKTPYIGSRAIWDINNIDEMFISKVSHEGIGFSSIGYSLIKKDLSLNEAIHISLGQNDYGNPQKILSAIAPGKIEEIEILGWKEFDDNKKISVKLSSGTVALDGERTIEFNSSQKISVKLNIDGPNCLKVKEILSA
jgi:predicted polyphosphate/ATP-dependent NAD kinase